MAIVLELTAITGDDRRKKFLAEKRVTSIGSAPSNDLVFFERQVEERHAEIHQMFGHFFIIPLTPNGRGVSLNGIPVSGRSRLTAGDVLTLGATSYRIAIGQPS